MLGLLLRTLVSVFLVQIVILGTDWHSLRTTLGKLSSRTVAEAIALNLAAHLFLVWRWKLALRCLRMAVAFPVLLRCYFIGALYNLFLPSNVGGDVARSYALFRFIAKPQLAAASSLVDRYTGFAALVLMALAGSLWLNREQDPFALTRWLTLLLVGFVGLSWFFASRWGRRLKPGRRSNSFRPLFVAANSLGSSLRLLRRAPMVLLGTLLTTTAYYLVVAATHKILAVDLDLRVPFHLLAIYVPVVAIVSMLPISINGIGLRELLYVRLFGAAGWSTEASLTVSWVVFASVLISGLPGLLLQVLPALPRKAYSPASE